MSNTTRLDLLPADVLGDIFRLAFPICECVGEDDPYRDQQDQLWLLSEDHGEYLSEKVQRIACETYYAYTRIDFVDDFVDILDDIEYDQSLGRCVRKLEIPLYHIYPRPKNNDRDYNGDEPLPSLLSLFDAFSFGDEDDDDTVEVVPRSPRVPSSDPVTEFLGRYYETAPHRFPNRGRMKHTSEWETWAVPLTKLLHNTPGLTEIRMDVHGAGMYPIIEGVNDDLVFPRLTHITLDESSLEGVLDIGGALLRSAPNLTHLSLLGFSKVLPPPACPGADAVAPLFMDADTDGDDSKKPLALTAKAAWLPHLESIDIGICDLSLSSVRRLFSILGPKLTKVDSDAPRIGTVDRNNGSASAPCTCYGMMTTLLKWKDTLKTLGLTIGEKDVLDIHADRDTHRLLLGTSLLPQFDHLETLHTTMLMFDSLSLDPQDAAAATDSVALLLPRSLRDLELFCEGHDNGVDIVLNNTRLVIKGIVRATKSGRLPHLNRISVGTFSIVVPETTMTYRLAAVDGSTTRTILLTCTDAQQILNEVFVLEQQSADDAFVVQSFAETSSWDGW